MTRYIVYTISRSPVLIESAKITPTTDICIDLCGEYIANITNHIHVFLICIVPIWRGERVCVCVNVYVCIVDVQYAAAAKRTIP